MAARKEPVAVGLGAVVSVALALLVSFVGGRIYNAVAVPEMNKHKAYDACMLEAGNYASLTATRCHAETGWKP